jgi:DNA-directed RNA polymerase specialized sigma24 family protein
LIVQDLADDPDGGDDEALVSVDDARGAISALSKADWARLLQVAKWLAERCGEAPHDLLQEATARAWAGRRRCRVGTPVDAFLAGIMKSLASQEVEARKAGQRPRLAEGFDDEVRPQWGAEQVSPERAAISRVDDGAVLAKIEALVSDSEQLQLLIEGLCDGLRGKDLEELLGVDAKGLAAARKMLRRRLNASFPERKVP